MNMIVQQPSLEGGRGGRTGISQHAGRQQPYTVWFRGRVLGFFEHYADAARCLRQALGEGASDDGHL